MPHHDDSTRLTFYEWLQAVSTLAGRTAARHHAHVDDSSGLNIRLDVHVSDNQTFTEFAGSVTRKLDQIITQLTNAAKQEIFEMATVQELNAKIDSVKASVEAETSVSDAIVTWMQGQGSIVAELKRQLAAALAAGGDQSAALQTAIDTLGVIETTNTSNAKNIADAMIANTPAEP